MLPPASVFLDGGKGHSVMGKSFQCKPETPQCQGSPYIQNPRRKCHRAASTCAQAIARIASKPDGLPASK